ncbi:MAG: hypothetical protein HY718_08730 [Planctomycetes bacterium]|nr:hypothetical protein [Planctomycetota bacterium]
MRWFRLPHTGLGNCVSGLMGLALVSGPLISVSCNGVGDFAGDPSRFLGLLVNTDVTSNFLGGIQLETGEKLSLFGRFKSTGEVDELQEVVYEDAEGRTSTLAFDGGLPSEAALHDGSTITITYEQADVNRLKGVVKVVVAGGGDSFQVPFDVDLGLALNQLGQMLSDLTGGAVQIAPDSGAVSPTARAVAPAADRAAKNSEVRQQDVIVPILVGLTVAATGFVVVSAMTQMLDAMRLAVEATTQAVVIAIFAPFIIIGEICRLAATRPLLTIDVQVSPSYLPGRRHG